MSLGDRAKIIEYWETLMMAVDLRAISGVPAKSLTFWVMMTSIPSYLRIRFANWYMKSRAIGLGKIITAEKKAEERYEREVGYLRDIDDNTLIAKGHYNLTKDLVLEYTTKNDLFFKAKPGSAYSVAVEAFAGLSYQEEERKQIADKLDRANPSATPDERDAEWARLEEKYTPYKVKAKEGCPWAQAVPRWLTQGHIFASPFYYIDYTLAQVLAFEFFNLDRKNHAKAWKKYMKLCKLGGKYPFITLITKVGLKNPFEPGVLKKTVRPLVKVLKGYRAERF
jgi:hypothetical protein